MAKGLSVKLPLYLDPDDGIGLNKTYRESVKQNFLNLLLTIPGERVMIPRFGVGLKRFLFENDNVVVRSNIMAKINEQTNKYLPYIKITNIIFTSNLENHDIDLNFLGIKIEYIILPLQASDEINLNRKNDDIVAF